MLVYRVCKQEEIENIFGNNHFLNIGSQFQNSDLNNHVYEEDSIYMHFFLKKDSILYLENVRGLYLCTYDIQEDILEKYRGIGYYWDYFHYFKLCEVVEYAVKSSDVKLDYLTKVELIEKDFDVDDYLKDSELKHYTKLIYEKMLEKIEQKEKFQKKLILTKRKMDKN